MMRYMIGNPQLMAGMSRKAQKTYIGRFTLNSFKERFSPAIEDIM
jgi:hypothetical protein